MTLSPANAIASWRPAMTLSPATAIALPQNYRRWVKEGKLQILIYNGDADFILSHMGNSAWINQGDPP